MNGVGEAMVWELSSSDGYEYIKQFSTVIALITFLMTKREESTPQTDDPVLIFFLEPFCLFWNSLLILLTCKML